MTAFVGYDITRLLMRRSVSTPNGIDRIDLAYARHFLVAPTSARIGVFLNILRPALIERTNAAALLAMIEKNWRDGTPNSACNFARVKAQLLGSELQAAGAPYLDKTGEEQITSRTERFSLLRLLTPRAFKCAFFDRLPARAVFIHSTHYPFEFLFQWLEGRRDIKTVFFIHDLLPLQYPEYFQTRNIQWHRRSLELFVRHGAAAIVNTHAVKRQLLEFLRTRGRRDVPVLVLPMPADPTLVGPYRADPDLLDCPYFVMCGTIEPRKNHLMILQLWRELARQEGNRTPKLIIIGRRGWENENVIDLLDRSHELRRHVIEVAGLPTSCMARLMAGARALLMPSFAEGYGLPIIEARALGTPVIASDIAVFREVPADVTFRHPLDGRGWLGAVRAHADGRHPSRACWQPPDLQSLSTEYFARVEEFIENL